MPRRKTLLNEFLDILEPVVVLYGLAMFYWWFFNKAVFWKWLFYGIAFIVGIIIIAIWRRKTRFKRTQGFLSDRELLLKLKRMHYTEFEEYIAGLFSKLDHKVKTRGGPYDQGIDVIAEKDGIKYPIQCKRYNNPSVGVSEVKEFWASISDDLGSGKGYLITTNIFTLEAERFAEGKPIELIDGQKLIKYIRMSQKKKPEEGSYL